MCFDVFESFNGILKLRLNVNIRHKNSTEKSTENNPQKDKQNN